MAEVPEVITRLSAPSAPNFHAWVTVNGEPVPIYSIEQKDRRASGYIESIEGARFEVHCSNASQEAPATAVKTSLSLDGQKQGSYTVSLKEGLHVSGLNLDHAHRTRTFDGRRVSNTSVLPFAFGSLALTDQEDLANQDETIVKDMGKIVVAQRQVVKVGTAECRTEFVAPAQVAPLHEQMKKARLSHQTTFGEAIERPKAENKRRVMGKYEDLPVRPIVVLELHYRSRALLEAEGRVPVAAAPAPAAPPALPTPPAQSTTTPSVSPAPVTPPVKRNKSQKPRKPPTPPPVASGSNDLARRRAQLEVAERELEVARLRAEIAEAEGAPLAEVKEEKKVKRESKGPQLLVKGASSRKRVKREDGKSIEVLVLSDSD